MRGNCRTSEQQVYDACGSVLTNESIKGRGSTSTDECSCMLLGQSSGRQRSQNTKKQQQQQQQQQQLDFRSPRDACSSRLITCPNYSESSLLATQPKPGQCLLLCIPLARQSGYIRRLPILILGPSRGSPNATKLFLFFFYFFFFLLSVLKKNA